MELLPFAGPLIGGLLGSDSTTTQQSTQKDLNEWLKPFVLGTNGQGGLLNDAQALYQKQAANGGLNPLQQAGIEAQRQFLTSPQYAAGYDQMRGQGMDLMGRSVAGNPFTSGAAPFAPHFGVPFTGFSGMAPSQPHPAGASGLNAANSFGYTFNPALMAGLQAPGAQQAPTAPATPQQAAPTIQDILAELARQQQQQANAEGPDGSGGGGF